MVLQPQTLDDIDFWDLDLFSEGDPHAVWTLLRREAPVWFHDRPGGEPFWSLTRYEDCKAVHTNPMLFSSERHGIVLRTTEALAVAELGLNPIERNKPMIHTDPPRHQPLRKTISHNFTPRAVAQREDDIRAVITTLLDSVIEQGACDFVRDVAVEFPLVVTANMLGVPQSDRGKLFEWTNKMADVSLPPEQGLEMMTEMAGYLVGLVSERRERPTDDLLSRLIHAEVDGEKLNDIEIVVHFAQLMAGGNETTRNAFAGGLLALIENPDQRQALLDDPSLIGSTVEEILRWHTPIMHNVRTATEDVELRGARIEEGQRLALWHVAANRDPAVVPDPDSFDISRGGVKHMSFSGGRHFCLGNQLARLELRICIAETLRRMPDMALAGPVGRFPNNTFHWMTSMPVSFTPGPVSR